MKLSEFNKLNKLAKKIGIRTFGDLYDFQQREKKENETLVEALIRYNKELGEDFKINE